MSLRLVYLFILGLIIQVILVGCSLEVDGRVVSEDTPDNLDRGRYLVEGIAACGSCHGSWRKPGAPLSGGVPFSDKFGEVLAPNITPSRLHGIGRWTATDIKQLFRTGRSRSDERVSHQAHDGFEWLSDSDVLSISTYLSALAPVESEVEHRTLSKLNPYNWVVAGSDVDVKGVVPGISPDKLVAYGHYLSKAVMRCSSCHNGVATFFGDPEPLGGGRVIKRGTVAKSAPTLAGILSGGSWSKSSLKEYLRTGKGPGVEQQDQAFCPTAFFSKASEGDLIAVVEYIEQTK